MPSNQTGLMALILQLYKFTIMKKRFLFLLLTCAALFACKPAEEPQTNTISEELLKSYFPYQETDRIAFFNDLIGDMNYTVVKTSFLNEEGQMILTVVMEGANIRGDKLCHLSLQAIVTENHILNIGYNQALISDDMINANNISSSASGTFVYDVQKDGNLPQTIKLSNESIIKQQEGLTYFLDYDSEKWYFKKRL